MATSKKPSTRTTEIEFEPDAWQRFERAVKVVVKSPPQHRSKPKRKNKVSPARKKAGK